MNFFDQPNVLDIYPECCNIYRLLDIPHTRTHTKETCGVGRSCFCYHIPPRVTLLPLRNLLEQPLTLRHTASAAQPVPLLNPCHQAFFPQQSECAHPSIPPLRGLLWIGDRQFSQWMLKSGVLPSQGTRTF